MGEQQVVGGSIGDRLTRWIAEQLPEASEVQVEGLSKVPVGHSAETLIFTLRWVVDGEAQATELVLRIRPPFPGLLEPYDLERQFKVLRALEGTPVRAPRAWWYEGSGEVLGAEFYVMERIRGTVYERSLPDDLKGDLARQDRMSRSLVEAIASIHNVRPETTDLSFLDPTDHVGRELAHWHSEIERVKKAPLPALERLYDELLASQPKSPKVVTLVHGDPKPGNFAFDEDGEIAGIFDWELATLGNPLADIGWAEINWVTPNAITALPGSLSVDDFVALYEDLSGIEVTDRPWYRAFEGFKIAVILLLASMLFDDGFSDDDRMASMGRAVPMYTNAALAELGVIEELSSGPVTASPERMAMLERRGR